MPEISAIKQIRTITENIKKENNSLLSQLVPILLRAFTEFAGLPRWKKATSSEIISMDNMTIRLFFLIAEPSESEYLRRRNTSWRRKAPVAVWVRTVKYTRE
jgi:hypothetical protein